MIIDRYTRPANLFESKVSDPILQELDWILDDPYLFDLVRRDLAKHYKASSHLTLSTNRLNRQSSCHKTLLLATISGEDSGQTGMKC